MQIVLLGAAVINSIFTDEWQTSLVLVGLTVFNAVLAMRGEAKAEASLAALAGTMKPIARVRRDGEAIEVDTGQIVPGGIVLVEAVMRTWSASHGKALDGDSSTTATDARCRRAAVRSPRWAAAAAAAT
jgi:magnesium-transporting ATPase (P-type)